jgi:hypothetical protein
MICSLSVGCLVWIVVLVRVMVSSDSRRTSLLPTRVPVPSLWPSLAALVVFVIAASLVRSIAHDVAVVASSRTATTRQLLAALAGGVCGGIFTVIVLMSTTFGV